MHIALERPDQADAMRLIDELDAYQRPLYPPESHHGIDVQSLLQPEVLFAVARDEQATAIACGAIVMCAQYAELKRMYVQPQARGRGVARALLAFLEQQALARNCYLFKLETGVRQLEALGLYHSSGYARCAPFGDYQPDPWSVFLHKQVVTA